MKIFRMGIKWEFLSVSLRIFIIYQDKMRKIELQ